MKIKICAGWENSKNITKRLLDQFITDPIDIIDLEFVYDDSYDIIVYNNYITELPKVGSKAFLFFHEPSWSGSHQKYFNEDITVFGFNTTSYNVPNGKLVEMPACIFYGGTGPYREGWDFWKYDNLVKTSFCKTKNISSIVSCLGNNGDSAPGCIYSKRYNLLKYLINSNLNFIDFYGCLDEKKSNTLPLNFKKDGLINYKFSLCIENSHEKNYISEKFYDCILTNTIPIYYGCSNIKDIWPYEGYINLLDIEDLESIKETLIKIESNSDYLYNKMLPNLIKIKTEFFNKYNIIKVVQKYVK